MNTKEVANKLVAYCRKGQFEEATKELENIKNKESETNDSVKPGN